MRKYLLLTGSLACVLAIPSIGRAQALPTATAHGFLQGGGGFAYAKPDYGQKAIQGITAFADFDFSPHLGVEAAFHYVSLFTPEDLGENSFVVGPRYVYRKGRFAPYAKLVAGVGDLVIQESADNPGRYSGTYFMYAFGGGLDIQATHHLVVRAIDAEYQEWPGLGNGLTPFVATVGVAYRFR
jgi:hypothetical protein